MKKIVYLFGGVGIALLGALIYQALLPQEKKGVGLSEQPLVKEEGKGLPQFEWSYQTSEKEGIPKTEIRLSALYENGSVESKFVDQVEGSCNDFEDADEDIYEGSTMLICYYAGLGHYFKIISDGDDYAVKRRVFEEASPEYDPPVEPYITVLIF